MKKYKYIILVLSMTLFLFGFDTINDKFEIDYNNNYKIIDNIDNTKTYLIWAPLLSLLSRCPVW